MRGRSRTASGQLTPPQPVRKLVPGPAAAPSDGQPSLRCCAAGSAIPQGREDQERVRECARSGRGAAARHLAHRAARRRREAVRAAAPRRGPSRHVRAFAPGRLPSNYFCSHSWATSRWHKYAALLVHFNLGRALIASLLMCYFCLFLQLWFPEWTPSWWWIGTAQPRHGHRGAPYSAEMFVAPTFFIVVLCTAHRFAPHRSLVLDIACIRQDSDAAKADGIAALGAVLDRSERMLVLCDANYFKRLWCTFELAAYTKRAGEARIDLLQ